MAPPARVWPHRRGNRGRDDRGADPCGRVWPRDRLHLCPHGPQPRHRLVEHGVGEAPPPWPPRLACGRTTVGIVAVTTAALIHVIVSGLATGCIYALMALSLVIIYNATRTLNFAQGEMLMISTFVAWSVQRALG